MKIYVRKRTTLYLETIDSDGRKRCHLAAWKEENLKPIKTPRAKRKKVMHRRLIKFAGGPLEFIRGKWPNNGPVTGSGANRWAKRVKS